MKNKIFWDHTSIGPSVTFHPSLSNPLTVLLKEQTIGLGCRHLASIGSEQGQFTATLGVDKSGEGLVAIIDKFNERPDDFSFLLPGDIPVPCIFHQRSVCLDKDTTDDYVSRLKSLHRSVSSASEVSLSRCLSLRLHVHLVGPNCKAQVVGLSPNNAFRAIPIPPLPMLSTVLTESLTRNARQTSKTGFLTMDGSGKLLLLLESDPRMRTSPIIGIWVSGVTTFVDPFVWASCLRFFSCPDYNNRVVRAEEPFLLVVYSTLHSSPEFYDCVSKTNKVTYDLLTGNAQLTVTKVPSFSSKVWSVSLCPPENPKQLKIFHDAQAVFHKEMAPVAYCETSVLAFSSGTEGYPLPPPTPTPPTKNFFLKPCVPDLSLLSEVSHCSVQRSNRGHQPPRPPLRELNNAHHHHPVASPSSDAVKRLQVPPSHSTQKNMAEKEGSVRRTPAHFSTEPLPMPPPPPPQSQPEPITLCNLRHEVERLLTPSDRKGPNLPGDTVGIALPKNVHNGKQFKENHTVCISSEASVGLSNNPTTIEDNVPVSLRCNINAPVGKPKETSEEDLSKKFGIFRSLQELLKQKDDKMEELREQVRELLDLQRNKSGGTPVSCTQGEEENSKLMSKIDRQNEELMELKNKISLLLEKQSREEGVSLATRTVPAEMEKCSVGVMTSILAETKEASASFSNQGKTCKPPLSTAAPRLRESLGPNRTECQREESVREVGCDDWPCSLPDLSVEQFRIERVNDTAVYSEKSMHLDLDQLQPPAGLSMDESLPLGASVSLLEGRLRKVCPSGRSSDPSSSSSSHSERDDHVLIKAWQRRRVRSREGRSRFSLPGQLRDRRGEEEECDRDQTVLGQRCWSLRSAETRDPSPSHHWEGSILLPKLNYQTLRFSDDSDSESGHVTDRLSEKYLKHSEEHGSSRGKRSPRREKKVGPPVRTSPVLELAELYSRNMSFATKEYLERYGLVS